MSEDIALIIADYNKTYCGGMGAASEAFLRRFLEWQQGRLADASGGTTPRWQDWSKNMVERIRDHRRSHNSSLAEARLAILAYDNRAPNPTREPGA